MTDIVVVVETPFANNAEWNRVYAIEACADCMRRGEVPFSSHLHFQPIFNELEKVYRERFADAGFAFYPLARKVVFYTDHDWSDNMKRAKRRVDNLGYQFEERRLTVTEPPKRSES
jgi:hypothetical protein